MLMPDHKVTIYNEFIHEQRNEAVKKIYPQGIHEAIATHLRAQPGFTVQTATLEMDEHGLTEEVLNDTDVLIWWGHMAHHKVKDEIVDRVQSRILNGMGLIVLHSGHMSKVFKRMMGTSCGLCWREAAERERLWVVNPNHEITEGLGRYIELPNAEMYGEQFDIPEPDELLFISWFEGGEVFRSGAVWHRGRGKVFYFRPGHEAYPIFYNPEILRVISNGVRWATFRGNVETLGIERGVEITEPIETIEEKDVVFTKVT
jgi:trehalose utilization protein|tara:strand:+ start:6010 stop:6786 length:777 start_codon:yes stop_codon:yes gene_type:complete